MRSQEIDAAFDPLDFISRLNTAGLRYLLIGSVAAAMHDIPIGSADYDFWVSPADRDLVYNLTAACALSGAYRAEDRRPQDTFTDSELAKIDFFFVDAFANEKKDIRLSFDEAYARSLLKRDSDGSFEVRIPSLDDLITMKQILAEMRPDQMRQLEYLTAKKEQSR